MEQIAKKKMGPLFFNMGLAHHLRTGSSIIKENRQVVVASTTTAATTVIWTAASSLPQKQFFHFKRETILEYKHTLSVLWNCSNIIWYAGIEWHQSKWKIFNASKNVTKSLNFCVGWKIIPKREKLTGLFYSMRSTWLMPFIFRWRILQVILGQPDALLHVSLDFMPEKRFFQLVFISWMMRWASEARNGGPEAQHHKAT